jgi:hypothetical protein
MMKSAIILVAFALVACAGQPPTEHLASSMAAVKTAESAGASQEPQASLHLKLAQAQVAEAQQMINEEEYEHADRMTVRAKSDADLALSLTREAQLKREIQTFASANPQLKAGSSPATAPAPMPAGNNPPASNPTTPAMPSGK